MIFSTIYPLMCWTQSSSPFNPAHFQSDDFQPEMWNPESEGYKGGNNGTSTVTTTSHHHAHPHHPPTRHHHRYGGGIHHGSSYYHS